MGKTDELCPYCGQEVEINAKCISKCPNCDKWICPCSMCNMDAVDCEGCELDKQTKIKNGE